MKKSKILEKGSDVNFPIIYSGGLVINKFCVEEEPLGIVIDESTRLGMMLQESMVRVSLEEGNAWCEELSWIFPYQVFIGSYEQMLKIFPRVKEYNEILKQLGQMPIALYDMCRAENSWYHTADLYLKNPGDNYIIDLSRGRVCHEDKQTHYRVRPLFNY